MKVDAELVGRVAELANLKLTPQEVTHYQDQLGKILAYVEQLESVRAEGVADEFDDRQSLTERADEAKGSLPVEKSMAAAPQKSGSAFQVPRVVE